jgi:hypothetical protein
MTVSGPVRIRSAARSTLDAKGLHGLSESARAIELQHSHDDPVERANDPVVAVSTKPLESDVPSP